MLNEDMSIHRETGYVYRLFSVTTKMESIIHTSIREVVLVRRLGDYSSCHHGLIWHVYLKYKGLINHQLCLNIENFKAYEET